MTSRSPPPSPGLRTLLFARVKLFFARQVARLKSQIREWRVRLSTRFKRTRRF
ncbi:hypothetical protein SAMN04487845_10413 [Methylobacterium sp. yr668]|nr:hypothetical protein SAMN04487845_10413 [Methylobacterium sp. yr668]